MRILFPAEPFGPQIDAAFAIEQQAAERAGLPTSVLGGRMSPGPALYRGWMLSVAEYETLHADLASQGVQLITSPAAYRTAHHLPAVYPFLEPQTAESLWFPEAEVNGERARIAAELARVFGSSPLVIKDYVKSEKGYWNEACFIPRADDPEAVWRVVDRFLEIRGPYLEGGVVFRRFLPLDSRVSERRIFWLDGQFLDLPDVPRIQAARFEALARTIPCRFFTMDVAFVTEPDCGHWTVIECGDGQVSGLPAGSEQAFYRALATRLSDDEPVTDEEAREVVSRLGIDTEAWAAEIRQRVAGVIDGGGNRGQ